jgi:2-methylcitrate dehydratase PrpD
LRATGFTGAPALTVERADARGFWDDLGTRWRIREQYFKAYPVCRWAQPAVEAALDLQRTHRFAAEESWRSPSRAFAKRSRSVPRARCPRRPRTRNTICDSPIAAALVFGDIGVAEVTLPRLADPRVERLQRAMNLTVDEAFSRRFPAERWARVRVTLADGRSLASQPACARGSCRKSTRVATNCATST